MNQIFCVIFLSLLSATAVAQENWSHWRGPTGNGVSETAKPPIEWDANTNVKWKVAIEGKGSGSPVIWQDKVFVVTAVTDGESGGASAGEQPGGRQQGGRRQRGGGGAKPSKQTSFELLCFNRANGEIIWEGKRDEPTNWGTPIIVEHNGKSQVVTTGQSKVRAYDLETGEELWSCGGQTDRPVASPVKFEDMVVVTSGHRGSFMGAFQLDGTGDIEGTEKVAWTLKRDTPDIGSPILSGNRLYFYKAKTDVE